MSSIDPLDVTGVSGAPAITLRGVQKEFPLFESAWEAAVVSLGRGKFGWVPGARSSIPVYQALRGIDIDVGVGERVGVVGRNGAGKTTLLKIITGVLVPDQGVRTVHGRIEALFDANVGFHPDLTGWENTRGALSYRQHFNKGLMNEVIDEIVDFVELGDFLHQPIKNYSKGMAARLAFAVATAIRPELVVIDEVMGAGDAYFSGKSARRMKRLLHDGCTLLLVSHSSAQVMQFCDRAIWIERGEVVKDGDALSVVKAYEEFTENLRKTAAQRVLPKRPRKL